MLALSFLDWIILEMKEKRERLSLLWLIECCRFTVKDYDKHQRIQMEQRIYHCTCIG